MPNKTKPLLRSDGRYYKRVYLGLKDGKKTFKNIYGHSQSEVSEKALQVKLTLKKGIDVSADRDSFEQWSTRWLKLKKTGVSAGRYVTYRGAVDKLAALNYIPISKISTYHIQDIILDLASEINPRTGAPAAKKTLLGIKSTAVQIFNMALINRVIAYNPAIAVEIPANASSSSRRALTEEEQGWIIDTPHRARIAAMVMMFAGLRRGELIPLEWGDVDLENRTIRVSKSVEMIDGKSICKDTAKTVASIRTIDLPQILVNFLAAEKPVDATEHTLLCSSAKGVMLTDSGWKRLWDSYLCDLNLKYGNIPDNLKSKHDPHGVPFKIPRITAHWLRHTFVTMMYLSGVDVLTAKEQAGHADVKTTLEIYTHLDAKFKRSNMDKLDLYLQRTFQKS